MTKKKLIKDVPVLLRMPESLAEAIKKKAEAESRSVNNWCKIKLMLAVEK